jgi:hypothetical protein
VFLEHSGVRSPENWKGDNSTGRSAHNFGAEGICGIGTQPDARQVQRSGGPNDRSHVRRISQPISINSQYPGLPQQTAFIPLWLSDDGQQSLWRLNIGQLVKNGI